MGRRVRTAAAAERTSSVICVQARKLSKLSANHRDIHINIITDKNSFYT